MNRRNTWFFVVSFIITLLVSTVAFAAEEKTDLVALRRQQENLLAEYNAQQKDQKPGALDQAPQNIAVTIQALQNQQEQLAVAIREITGKLSGLDQNGMADTINDLRQKQTDISYVLSDLREKQMQKSYAPAVTTGVLPAGNTQDAIDAERDAEMTFSYSSGGMYKIYCKTGYLTDIRFRPGEKITFVGGGDTAKWMLDTANTGSGEGTVAHLYIKPITKNARTNLIVNTTNHTYQILVNTAEWYNPIVSWSYTSEEQLAGKIAKEKEEVVYTEKSMNLSRPENLNFGYKIEKDRNYRWAPIMVFDDRYKTYIKMPETIRQGNAPILFIKERHKNDLSLVNYRIKDNFYIVDRLFEQAELRVSEKEFVRIISRNDY